MPGRFYPFPSVEGTCPVAATRRLPFKSKNNTMVALRSACQDTSPSVSLPHPASTPIRLPVNFDLSRNPPFILSLAPGPNLSCLFSTDTETMLVYRVVRRGEVSFLP